MFYFKKEVVSILCIFTLLLTPSLTFAGQTWGKIKKNIMKCEFKIQGCTTDLWADIISPSYRTFYADSGSESSKLSTRKKAFYAGGASGVVRGAKMIIKHNDSDSDDPTVYATD